VYGMHKKVSTFTLTAHILVRCSGHGDSETISSIG
jgi:hypothetical protein